MDTLKKNINKYKTKNQNTKNQKKEIYKELQKAVSNFSDS